MTKVANQRYLELAEKRGIDPNFYLSEAYLNFSGAKTVEDNGWLRVLGDGWQVLPPLPIEDPPEAFQWEGQHHGIRVWSDYFYTPFPMIGSNQFLDYEYLFNSLSFNDLRGGSWEVYRKNVRKWPKSHENWSYSNTCDKNQIDYLLADWLEARKETVQDIAVILQFVRKSTPGVGRKFLFDSDYHLYAINVWDENYQYINYRFCVVRPGEPFLDEFARYLFYTDPEIQGKSKLVNDGGVLDSPGLEHFKDKLHPMRKRKVYSWILK